MSPRSRSLLLAGPSPNKPLEEEELIKYIPSWYICSDLHIGSFSALSFDFTSESSVGTTIALACKTTARRDADDVVKGVTKTHLPSLFKDVQQLFLSGLGDFLNLYLSHCVVRDRWLQ